MREEVLKKLKAKRDENYKSFNTKLIPGVDLSKVLGVRLPDIRTIAKEVAKGDYQAYIKELPKDCYYEERMVHGMVLGYGKLTWEEWKKLTPAFVKHIHDWATCDSCSSGMKIIKKNREEGWDYLQQFLGAKGEYEVRFGITMLMDHYCKESEYTDRIIEAVRAIDRDDYYIMMARAWLISVMYVHFPEKTEKLFTDGVLDKVTHNKAIQKIRESNRVDACDKERLNAMKIK